MKTEDDSRISVFPPTRKTEYCQQTYVAKFTCGDDHMTRVYLLPLLRRYQIRFNKAALQTRIFFEQLKIYFMAMMSTGRF